MLPIKVNFNKACSAAPFQLLERNQHILALLELVNG